MNFTIPAINFSIPTINFTIPAINFTIPTLVINILLLYLIIGLIIGAIMIYLIVTDSNSNITSWFGFIIFSYFIATIIWPYFIYLWIKERFIKKVNYRQEALDRKFGHLNIKKKTNL